MMHEEEQELFDEYEDINEDVRHRKRKNMVKKKREGNKEGKYKKNKQRRGGNDKYR